MTKYKLTNFCELSSPMKVLHYLHVPMTTDSKRFKTIVIDKQNYIALRRLGFAGESFNDVLTRIIRSAKRERLED